MGFPQFGTCGGLAAGPIAECAAIVIAGFLTLAGQRIKMAKPYHLVNQETTCP